MTSRDGFKSRQFPSSPSSSSSSSSLANAGPSSSYPNIAILVTLLTFSALLTMRAIYPYMTGPIVTSISATTVIPKEKLPAGVVPLSALLNGSGPTVHERSASSDRDQNAKKANDQPLPPRRPVIADTSTREGLPGRFTHALNWVSPSNGTDILSHPTAVAKCANQTSCIAPQLQLATVFNIYYCKHVSYGVRFYFLVREGLLLHPNVNLVSDPDKAELIVWLPGSAEWSKSECNNPNFKDRLVVTATLNKYPEVGT